MTTVRRAFINCPSSDDPLNSLSGTHGWVLDYESAQGDEVVQFIPLHSAVTSMMIPRRSLSLGWQREFTKLVEPFDDCKVWYKTLSV